VQAKVFAAVGFNEDEARPRFGYLLDGWKYGRAAARRHSRWGWTAW